ncbi:MAG: pyridoxal phosphate-dependent aminotransferase [Deltaproteobacteria bacterium]|jgi:aspartate aminotransferase|nr:pyridoxal phosphate-dependent aminotransferase [Deltaproteobacteria bacterium]
MRFAERMSRIQASRTVQFTVLMQRLKKEGRRIISFAVGEPEYPTPPEIVRATCDALENGKTRYGAVQGNADLRSRLAERFEGYDGGNILLSNGSKQCLYSIFQTLCGPGDQVIIPRPYWVSFSEQIRLAGAIPVFVDTRAHQLDCEAIAAAVTDRTRIILINNPNNPTGAVYPREDVERVAELALRHDLYILSDEAYEYFTYDGRAFVSPYAIEAVRDRCVVVRSFSKSHCMTGFRVGYVAAPVAFIEALSTLQSHLSGNVCSFAQEGALAALKMDASFVEWMRSDLQRKRDIAYGYAGKLFTCIEPHGAFYLFADVSAHLSGGRTAEDLAAALLEEAGVAVVPGEAFGVQNHIRISYALPEEELVEGFERMAEAL